MVKGRLAKWKWLAPNMLYRGRVLIVNNLVSSLLWHRMACLNLPVSFLKDVQAVLVDFLWDKLHWVTQCVLFLPREEGRQGLVHLQSRAAAFHLQFLQRLLYGPADSNWKTAACAILRSMEGLNLSKSLFLMDPCKVDAGVELVQQAKDKDHVF